MKTALKLLLTITALWFAFHNVQWVELQAAYHHQQAIYLVAATLAIALQIITGGLRWNCIRRSARARDSIMLYYASTFFNTIIPSTLGSDAARIVMAKNAGDSAKNATITIDHSNNKMAL